MLPPGPATTNSARRTRPELARGVYILSRVDADDAELLRRFESAAVPFYEWTHRAHVRVAFLLLRAHPFDEALARMRAGVKAHNAVNRVRESPTSGYNETTTRAFLHLIAATIAAYEAVFAADTSASFCDTHPQLMTRHALRFFYSPQRRMHPMAKAQFVEPDLAPLPRIHGEKTSDGG